MSAIFLWMATAAFGQQPEPALIDHNASFETKRLFSNLHELSRDHILYGHQHATEYGHGWSGDENRSDVKSVTGSHPAVIGVDFLALANDDLSTNETYRQQLIKTIADTYDRGGVVTAAWHMKNPVSNTGFYWKEDGSAAPAVRNIIPGGSHHEVYKKMLADVASVALNAKGKDGNAAPMIFRPFHEFDGDWFWWGRSHSSIEEFKSLWRFTVSYLRDSLKVHNFIYAFSPDNRFDSEQQFLERYPGDEWVDMVGMDNYGDFGRDGSYDLDAAFRKLKIVSDYARKAGKLAALTETGLESIADEKWHTESLLKTLKRENLQLSYVLVWRNDVQSPTHYYAPYPGHSAVKDFLEFYHDPYVLFENDLQDIYGPRRKMVPTPVLEHGKLRVKGNQLVNKKGDPVALHGMSYGWHNWWPRFYNTGTVGELHSKWKVNVVRAAMGVDPKGAYLTNPEESVKLVENVVDAAIKQGIYVIIDWHSHTIKTSEAKQFFARMAKKYGKHPHVIYEIFNEPVNQGWDSVKNYSIEVMREIRKYDPDNIILVGSTHWDQDIHLVADDPITGFENIMYTMHFYAASHHEDLRKRTDYALQKGIPIFVSECAGMSANGDGPVDHASWNTWVKWMDERNLSWVAWSVSDKDESCSVLQKQASSTGNWSDEDLKEWGKIARKYLWKY